MQALADYKTFDVPLSQVGDLVEQSGLPRPSVGTIRRWMVRGARGKKLAGRRRGGFWFSSAEAVAEFLAETVSA